MGCRLGYKRTCFAEYYARGGDWEKFYRVVVGVLQGYIVD